MCENKSPITRIEYEDDKVDSLGRRHFVIFWNTTYTPYKPYPHERAQHYFADPTPYEQELKAQEREGLSKSTTNR